MPALCDCRHLGGNGRTQWTDASCYSKLWFLQTPWKDKKPLFCILRVTGFVTGDSGGVEDAPEESVVTLRQLCEMKRAGPGATGEPQPLNWVTN